MQDAHKVLPMLYVEYFEMPWHIPQYIGKNEIDKSVKMRGYLLPDDEDAHEYYSNRRLEDVAQTVWGMTSMWKVGSPPEDASPSRKACRSKSPVVLASAPVSHVVRAGTKK